MKNMQWKICNENFSKKNMHILVGFYLYELSSKSFISAWEEQRCGHYEAKFFWKWHMNFHMHFWVCCLLTASTDFQGTKHALLYKGFGHQVPDPAVLESSRPRCTIWSSTLAIALRSQVLKKGFNSTLCLQYK